MSDEIEVTQALPEGETVHVETAPEQAPETVTEQTPEEQKDEPEKPKHKPWFQERIDQLTREKYDAIRAREAVEARLTEALANPDATPPSAGDLDTLAAAKAKVIVETQQFNAKCDEIYTSGAAEFPDFDEAIDNFKMLGGLTKPFLDAVTQLPDAHKVLHSLGKDMDEAARILALPDVPMAIALAKLSQGPAKTKPVSKAPPPIKPIDGMPTGTKSQDDMTTEEWVEWREKDIASRKS